MAVGKKVENCWYVDSSQGKESGTCDRILGRFFHGNLKFEITRVTVKQYILFMWKYEDKLITTSAQGKNTDKQISTVALGREFLLV